MIKRMIFSSFFIATSLLQSANHDSNSKKLTSRNHYSFFEIAEPLCFNCIDSLTGVDFKDHSYRDFFGKTPSFFTHVMWLNERSENGRPKEKLFYCGKEFIEENFDESGKIKAVEDDKYIKFFINLIESPSEPTHNRKLQYLFDNYNIKESEELQSVVCGIRDGKTENIINPLHKWALSLSHRNIHKAASLRVICDFGKDICDKDSSVIGVRSSLDATRLIASMGCWCNK